MTGQAGHPKSKVPIDATLIHRPRPALCIPALFFLRLAAQTLTVNPLDSHGALLPLAVPGKAEI